MEAELVRLAEKLKQCDDKKVMRLRQEIQKKLSDGDEIDNVYVEMVRNIVEHLNRR